MITGAVYKVAVQCFRNRVSAETTKAVVCVHTTRLDANVLVSAAADPPAAAACAEVVAERDAASRSLPLAAAAAGAATAAALAASRRCRSAHVDCRDYMRHGVIIMRAASIDLQAEPRKIFR